MRHFRRFKGALKKVWGAIRGGLKRERNFVVVCFMLLIGGFVLILNAQKRVRSLRTIIGS